MNIVESNTNKSVRDLWETPQWLVDQVEEILKVNFLLDPCCTELNAKCAVGLDEEDNGLFASWDVALSKSLYITFAVSKPIAVWVNPPFSQLSLWIDKVIEESHKGFTVVVLHPDTPDTAWYQKLEKHCFLQLVPTSRINFIDPETGKQRTGVSFPSVISVFNGFPKTNVQRVRFNLNRPKTEKGE